MKALLDILNLLPHLFLHFFFSCNLLFLQLPLSLQLLLLLQLTELHLFL